VARPVRARLEDPDSVAELATAGVEHHLARQEWEIARALQGVAAMAWALVHEPGTESCRALREEITRAEDQLSRLCHANQARRFLRETAAFLSQREATLSLDWRRGAS